MKTLDEVIKNFEICRKARLNIRSCDGCTYADDNDIVCISHNECDALHYLKEYRETKKHLACLDAAEIRGEDTQVVNNPPLTWDELKAMAGKPVWIVPEEEKGYWFVIEFFNNNQYYGGDRVFFTNNVALNRCDLGKTWQAYRKERDGKDSEA